MIFPGDHLVKRKYLESFLARAPCNEPRIMRIGRGANLSAARAGLVERRGAWYYSGVSSITPAAAGTERRRRGIMFIIILGILALVVALFANFTLSVTLFFIFYFIVDFIVSCRQSAEESEGPERPGPGR
jgi:hypothetical protein